MALSLLDLYAFTSVFVGSIFASCLIYVFGLYMTKATRYTEPAKYFAWFLLITSGVVTLLSSLIWSFQN